jgi:hypothetical protein
MSSAFNSNARQHHFEYMIENQQWSEINQIIEKENELNELRQLYKKEKEERDELSQRHKKEKEELNKLIELLKE